MNKGEAATKEKEDRVRKTKKSITYVLYQPPTLQHLQQELIVGRKQLSLQYRGPWLFPLPIFPLFPTPHRFVIGSNSLQISWHNVHEVHYYNMYVYLHYLLKKV